MSELFEVDGLLDFGYALSLCRMDSMHAMN
jgi:hypothetical protein